MPFFTPLFQVNPEGLARSAQQRLFSVRTALILGEHLGVVLLLLGLNARLPVLSVALILALHTLLNGLAWLRLRAGNAAVIEVALQLGVDAACIGALVFLTGGYANPFISLLLVPLILSSVTLPPLYAWGMALWVGSIYTFLMRFYQPLQIQVSPEAAVDMHLTGMWLNFLLTAALVAAFAGHQAATLRRRDAALTEARELRLRDEHLFALGLQAATAAHDLATPMNSVRITLDELQRDYAGDEELDPPLALLSGQVARMQEVLTRLGQVARARGMGETTSFLPTHTWLNRTIERWGLMWPHVQVHVQTEEPLPLLADDAALEAVLTILLNNAAQAASNAITLKAWRADSFLYLEVADYGTGLIEDQRSVKPDGWGVGLDLARAALAGMGGTLDISASEGGGVYARLILPLNEQEPQ